MDAQTLIKKLVRSGKHAELWPENYENKEKRSGKSNNNDKQKSPKDVQEVGDDGHHQKSTPAENPETDAKTSSGNGGDDQNSDAESDDAGEESAAPVAAATSGDGSGKNKKKKKKKKKRPNGNSNNGANGAESGGVPADTGSSVAALYSAPPIPLMIQSPPPPDVYPYPPMHYPPPPAYGINYRTAYPSASESYYTHPMHDHVQYYYQNRYQPPAPPSDPINEYGDDDNETGCSVM